MQAIDWKLIDIYPTTAGSLFSVAYDWEKSNVLIDIDMPMEKSKLVYCSRYGKLISLDQSDPNAKYPWRTRLGKTLFKVRTAFYSQLKRIAEEINKDRKLSNELWLMRNCRPAGGNWQPSQPLNPDSPVGKPCMSRLCPWCHLRRLNDLAPLLRLPYGQKMTSFNSAQLTGLGLGEHLSAVTLTAYATKLFDRDSKVTDRALFNELLQTADRVVRERTPGRAEFNIALKITSPIYRYYPGKTVRGWRVSYIHDTQHVDRAPDSQNVKGFYTDCDMKIERWNQLPVRTAFREAAPYPIDILHPSIRIDRFLSVLDAMRGTRFHTTREFPKTAKEVPLSSAGSEGSYFEV